MKSQVRVLLLAAGLTAAPGFAQQVPPPASPADATNEPAAAAPVPAAPADPAVSKAFNPFGEALKNLRYSSMLPFPFTIMLVPFVPNEPNTVSEPFPDQLKETMMMMAGAMSPWSMRQMFNMMTYKRKVADNLSIDEVLEAMDSRAIEVNLKKVAHTPISKELDAKRGTRTPVIHILQYCDAEVARAMLDYSPEFSVFIPCRISVIEDGQGALWIMTMDWNVAWLSLTWHPDSKLPDGLMQEAIRVRDAMRSVIDAGATGDWG
ncbi:MAG: DUF302 domain-containing protein [Gammaproteobacteria bacterium]|nr:DUF302 domain-containing protein [Gammaproteobacteria bacterium]